MLKYVYGIATGRAHKVRGGCGADSALAILVSDTLYFALSDGAGSSKLSHRVSDTLVYEAIRLMMSGMVPHDIPEVLSVLVKEVFSGIDRRHLYATLVVGTYTGETLTYASVGDSAVLYRTGGKWYSSEIVKGEFANETVFLLSEGWKDMLKVGQVSGVDGLVVSSDGLGGIYFYYKMKEEGWYIEPHEAYLNKLLHAVKTDTLTYDNIAELLSNDRLMDINDDDKSVVIACAGV